MLAFITHVYQDHALARRTLGQLRQFYSTEAVICIADGTSAPEFKQYCAALNIHYIEGERLKLMQHGGAWLHRAFTSALQFSWQILIKFDPDTCFHRAFQVFPEANWFGNIQDRQSEGLGTYISGGCLGYRRAAIEQLLDSKMLNDPIYTQLPYGYQRFGRYRWPNETFSDELVAYCDLISGHVAHRLGWSMAQWSEIWFHTRILPPASLDVAASHPHPELPLPYYEIPHFLDSVLYQEVITTALVFEKVFQPFKRTGLIPEPRQGYWLSCYNFPRLTERILSRLREILPEIGLALGINCQAIHPIELQMISYGDGDFYKPHRDNSAEWCAQRRISFSCCVHTYPKIFRGGQLVLDPGYLLDPVCNGLMCYPSGTINQVLPVSTSGEWVQNRFSLEGWVSISLPSTETDSAEKAQ